jgi:colicin import membrane protein
MRLYSLKPYSKPLAFYLRRSTYFHAALIVLTLSGSKIAFEIARSEREKNLELIQASVRVDMVAMPTHTLNELKNMSSGVEEAKKEEPTKSPEPIVPTTEKVEEKVEPKEPEPKVVEKDPVPALEEASKVKRMDFLSKLKKIGSKKVESEGNQKAEKGLYGEKSTNLKNLVLSGNKLNNGVAMYGDGGATNMTAYQTYAVRVTTMVKPHWKLPSYLLEKNLKCRVRVWLAMNGEVTRSAIYQSSGDQEFDQRAIEAIQSASPFPAVAEDIGKKVLNGDIVLGFPL